ncbi:hypothetical protein EUGRSUZ_I00220 [Eucalyptus grandis]|uniref:Uncharacterized protein n=2 Tax=Eucalyptus grandis TaxID=71139 RepID=A0ACC3JC31_EUCGR|nr:hypothetical protein EUGRSUZ_I00220 [Eucalyptus grandis]
MALNPNIELSRTVPHEPQQETSEDRQIEIETDGGENQRKGEPRPLESQWMISINDILAGAKLDNGACSWAKRSIYRIPHYLKDGQTKACVPQIVSLGPYYHGDERLREKDKDKWRGLVCMLERKNQKIEEYLDAVKQVEERARACYEGVITMSSEEFVMMMVLDGCFVIELFWGWSNGFDKLGYTQDDPVFSELRSLMHLIQRDMILLENQIPLFILDLLFNLQCGQPNHDELLAKLALKFLHPLRPTECPFHCVGSKRLESNPLANEDELQEWAVHCLVSFQPSLSRSSTKRAVHCLELFRRSLLCLGPRWAATLELSQIGQPVINCVTELRKKGIKFKKGEDGTLEFPWLKIEETTLSLFLNLIAFEQCHFDCDNDVTSYLFFMDKLINSAKDVEHLHDCGIMDHWLGSDAEAANLFNQLCKEVVLVEDVSYLSKLSKDVNTYSGNKWNCWIASLKLKYFSNPWSIISLIAAFILLMLTLAQTFYGVYGYYKPRS